MEKSISIKDSIKNTSETTTDTNPSVNYSDSINFTDSNGLKQGQWIKKWKGKLVEKYTYINDTLNGHYESDHKEGFYRNGQKDGFDYLYYGEKESILMVNFYENGTHIWGGCPASGREYLVPVKDFQISKDSIFIKASYINKQTWYEGSFCLLPDSLNNGRLFPHRYGVHKVYHMNGKLRGIIDYNKETILEFDSLGNQKYQATFKQTEIHKLPTLGRYKKK
jgi:hypothetical protein